MEIVLMIPKYVGASEPLSCVHKWTPGKKVQQDAKEKKISYHLYAARQWCIIQGIKYSKDRKDTSTAVAILNTLRLFVMPNHDQNI